MNPSTPDLENKQSDLGVTNKDNLRVPEGEEGIIDTKYGPVKYVVHGDIKSPAFVTYHDIGLNHESCFSTFFDKLYQADRFFNQFCLVQIDAPGHAYGASEVPNVAFFDMEELAEQVQQIVVKLNIKIYFGLGAGAGATVLLHNMLKYPKGCLGLVLFGAQGGKCSWEEWAWKWFHWTPSVVGITSWWKHWLLTRWFSSRTLGCKPDLVQKISREVDRMNFKNVFKYVQGFQRRKDILGEVPKIRRQVLLMAGDCTVLEDSSNVLLGVLNPESDMILERDAGMLLPVEKPEAIFGPLKLSLQGAGFI